MGGNRLLDQVDNPSAVVQKLPVIQELQRHFCSEFTVQMTAEGIVTVWVQPAELLDVLLFLRQLPKPYVMLFDLSAIDERSRQHRQDMPVIDFTVFYHLLSINKQSTERQLKRQSASQRNTQATQHGSNDDKANEAEIRIKVALNEDELNLPSVTSIYPNASWYEREVWDMFGIEFVGHPDLRRILLPNSWTGHPLRKDYRSEKTNYTPQRLAQEKQQQASERQELIAKQLQKLSKGEQQQAEFMFFDIGIQASSLIGSVGFLLQMTGERIVDCVPEIGQQHRGVEKLAEAQAWQSFIHYTDKVDYQAGVMNELPYVMAIEQLADIQTPAKAQMIRVMLSELFRINNHLLYFANFVQQLGLDVIGGSQISALSGIFTDRQKIYEVIEAITGARVHPNFLRVGGVAYDLPNGWQTLVTTLLDWLSPRLVNYEKFIGTSLWFKQASKGVAKYDARQALSWGVTGAGLRATGVDYDVRKAKPYMGYENFDFDVPVFYNGDAYDRSRIKLAETLESLRIIRQCVQNMPEGNYQADYAFNSLTASSMPESTVGKETKATKVTEKIEKTEKTQTSTLKDMVNQAKTVWQPIIPAGEACVVVETGKGASSYYLISDEGRLSYRTRIRMPTFAHVQQLPKLLAGASLEDLPIYLSSMDVLMSACDR